MKKKQKGSALLWAVILLLILDVVIAGALTISYAYYNRVFITNEKRQAYLTSKGIIEDIVEKIKAGNAEYLSLFADLEVNESTSITVQMPNASVLGNAKASIEKLDPKETRGLLTITVTTQYADETETVKADLQLGKVDGVEHWQLLRYYKGDPIPVADGKNIVAAKEWLTEMDLILAYKTNMKGLNDYYKKDATEFANLQNQYLATTGKEWKDMGWFDNTGIRTYLFFRKNPGSWIPFDLNEIKDEDKREDLKKTFASNEFWIQPYFVPSSYTELIVYANKTNAYQSWTNVPLIYNGGHWYYIPSVIPADFIDGGSTTPKQLSVIDFSDQTGGTSSNVRWSRFKEKYLTNENMVQ